MWPFSKKRELTPVSALRFKSGADFFKYQCKFGHTDIKPRHGIVALVIDAEKEFGVSQAVKIEADGRQMATLKVVSKDGGFIVNASTASGEGDRLKPDDVVIWVPVDYVELAVERAEGIDPRFGLLGFIVAKVAPEIDPNSPSFKVLCQYG
jgi:hypothetical protein